MLLCYFIFIGLFEKRDVLWEHLRRAGGRRSHGFRSVSQRVFIKFYNQPNPPGTPELWPLNYP